MSKKTRRLATDWKWRVEQRQMAIGISSKQVAEAAGMGISTYRQAVNGSNMTVGTMLRICEALGVPPDWLVKQGERGEMAKEAVELSKPAWLAEIREEAPF